MNDYGFKEAYNVDIGDSIMLYSESMDVYEAGKCYNNAFNCLVDNFDSNNQAVFGYVLSSDGTRKVAVRHAWNIINNCAVDVTMFANQENPLSLLNYLYLPVRSLSIEQFVKAVEANDSYPCLPKTGKEKKIISRLESLGFEVLE